MGRILCFFMIMSAGEVGLTGDYIYQPAAPLANQINADGPLEFRVHLNGTFSKFLLIPMTKTRGSPSVQQAPLKTEVAHWLATNGRGKCDESNGRPALVRAFRGVYDIVHSTEKQCSPRVR